MSAKRYITLSEVVPVWISHGVPHMIRGLVIALALGTPSVYAASSHVAEDDPVVDTDTVPLPALSPRQANQLRIFEPILLNPSVDIDQATRTAAATELLAMDVTQATQVLGEALQSRETSVILAVTEALGEQATPPPASLLQPTVEALRDAPTATQDALSRVLLRFNPRHALAQVAMEANDSTAPPEERLGAIRALAAFRSRQGALELMQIIQNSDSEPKIIVDATCESLADLTGLPPSEDPSSWRRWWRINKDKPAESWLRDMVRTLTRQLSDLDQELQEERKLNGQLASRMMDSYRKLWPGLPLQERQLRLVSLMTDRLVAVRLFAIERMAILLRDDDDTVELQEATVLLLNDKDPTVRVHAARLADELEFPELQESVAVALSAETEPNVVREYLLFFANKPSPGGLAPSLPWLADEQLREPAAEAIWSILTKTPPEETETAALRDVLAHTTRDNTLPALERLQALVAEDESLDAYEARLDIAPVEERYAIGQGLLARGRYQPLIDRMQDESLYPLAVESLTTSEPNLTAVLTLSSVNPPDTHTDLFENSMRTLATTMPADTLIDVDTVLQRSDYVDDVLRANVLEASLSAHSEELTSEQKEAILLRLLPLLLANGEVARATTLLSSTDEVLFSPALSKLAFRTALITGDFERALSYTQNSESWLTEFETLIGSHREAARRLQPYLLENFRSKLSSEQLSRFGKAVQVLDKNPTLTNEDELGEAANSAVQPESDSQKPPSSLPTVGPESNVVEGLPTSGETQ